MTVLGRERLVLAAGFADLLVGIAAWYIFLGLLSTVYSETESVATVSLLLGLRLLVSAGLSLPLSVAADRRGAASTAAATVAAYPPLTLLLYIVSTGSSGVYTLFVLAMIAEAVNTAYNTVKYALPPRLASAGLEKANAVFEAAYSLLMAVGPLAAAALLGLGAAGLVVVLVLEASAAIVLYSIAARTPLATGGPEGSGGSLAAELAEAARRVIHSKELRTVFAVLLAATAAGAVVNLAQVPAAASLGAIGFTAGYSMLTASTGLGSLVASIAVIRGVLRAVGPMGMIRLGSLAMAFYPAALAAALLCDAHTWTVAVLLAASLVNGLGNSLLFIALTTLLQRLSGNATARIIALATVSWTILAAAVTIAAGVLSSYLPAVLLASVATLAAIVPSMAGKLGHAEGSQGASSGLLGAS